MAQKILFDDVVVEVVPHGLQYAARAYQQLGPLRLPLGDRAIGHTPQKARSRCLERLANEHRRYRRAIH